jgi:multimeric flavodoxin WrbA
MRESDGIVFGSPSHYGTVASGMKNLLDRVGRFVHLEGKVGFSFVVSARSGPDIVLYQLLFFMLVKEMTVPGCYIWPTGQALNVGDIRADPESMAMARLMGERIAILAKTFKEHPVPWSYEGRPSDKKVRFGDEWKTGENRRNDD